MEIIDEEQLREIPINFHITPNRDWIFGYQDGVDTHCFVMCMCGEMLSVNYDPKKCLKCGRVYWNEFITYRVETDEQYEDTMKQEMLAK